jgi:hypothetical protein
MDAYTKIRRTAPNDQLVVSMTKDDLNECIEFTVDHFRGLTKNPIYSNTEALREAVTSCDKFYLKFDDVPLLAWPLGKQPGPELEAGQHRRMALIQKHGLSRENSDMQILHPDNVMVSPLCGCV